MGFELKDKKDIPLFNSILYRYIHSITKCEVLHIYNDDPENIYIFAIPSFVNNETGLPHILEHTVFCGSQKYRIKSPFFKLEQGSCKTYLNAATYPDRTFYIGASTLKKDFFNLMAMSGDAIWYPLLHEKFFRQEGFHLHYEKDKVSTAGVVYNEMKGVYSDKVTIIENEINKRLLRDTIYRYDSGGTPESIPHLSYKEFLEFHDHYYRPEHTKILVYGNIKSKEYLQFIDKELLSRWNKKYQPLDYVTEDLIYQSKIDFVSLRKNKKDFINIIQVPSSEHAGGEEGSLDITWLLAKTNDAIQMGILRFMHFVLLGIPGGPIRKKILESTLADDLSPLSGQNSYLPQATFTIGACGVKNTNYKKLLDLIFAELETIVKVGIRKDLKEAALSRIEFTFKERLNSTQGKINWLSNLASRWIYNDDPIYYADSDNILKLVKQELARPKSIETYIQKNLLDNFHRVVVATQANNEFSKLERSKEQKLLKSLDQASTKNNDNYWKIKQQEIEDLRTIDDTEVALAAIPKITKQDIPKKIRIIPHHIVVQNDLQTTCISQNNNGVIYIQLQFDITDLITNQDTRLIIPTLSASLTDIGIKNVSYEDIAIKICLTTGRFLTQIQNYVCMDGSNRVFINVTLSVLIEKLDLAFSLLHKILSKVDFSNTIRLQEIINEGKAMMRDRILDSGTSLAIIAAAKNYSINAKIDDDWNGLSQLKWVLNLQNLETLSSQLETLNKIIFTQERLSCTIACHEDQFNMTLKKLAEFKSLLPPRLDATRYLGLNQDINIISTIKDSFGKRILVEAPNTFKKNQALILPVQVAFNVMILPAVSYIHKDFAKYQLTARLLSEKLLQTIRMKFGAYGASASLLGDESLFMCFTYRDPYVKNTFTIFKKEIQGLAEGDFTDQGLESHIVGAVGADLMLHSPLKKLKLVSTRQFINIKDDLRQTIKDNLMSCTRSDIQKVAQELLEKIDTASLGSVCNEEKSKEMNWDSKEYVPH